MRNGPKLNNFGSTTLLCTEMAHLMRKVFIRDAGLTDGWRGRHSDECRTGSAAPPVRTLHTHQQGMIRKRQQNQVAKINMEREDLCTLYSTGSNLCATLEKILSDLNFIKPLHKIKRKICIHKFKGF